jgi:phospholipase D1/2
MGVIGDCVYDIAEHFVLRWNFVKRDKISGQKTSTG